MVNARNEAFDFLGFTFRYVQSPFSNWSKFWNVFPKAKSQKKIRQKINLKLKSIEHYPANKVVDELNPIIGAWINYYKIEKVSYTQVALKDLEDYLRNRLFRYYNGKSQRKSSLYGKRAFNILVEEYGLIKPYMTSGLRPVNTLRRNF